MLLALALLTLASLTALQAAPTKPLGWIIDAAKAKRLHAKGALFIDVRHQKAYKAQHIRGAIHTTWQHFSSRKIPHIGRLLKSDKALQEKLRAIGVSSKKAVIVVGDPHKGWGEEGRIVWMLRSLGHRRAAFVDGGYKALQRARLPMSRKQTTVTKGDFVVKRSTRWSTTRQKIRLMLQGQKQRKPLFVDTRELREYKGAVPYGESRGGHLPGAVHLHYKELLHAQGKLLSRKRLLQRLQQKGIRPTRAIVAYCTGGVRSAWFVAVLVHLGFARAKNYGGSMWEWSAYPAKSHLLVK